MYIYSIKPKNGVKEIYIGKTNNFKERLYGHKSCCVKDNKQSKYKWMNSYGWENLIAEVLFEYENENENYELVFIEKFKTQGWKVINDQLNDYHPLIKKRFDKREEVWREYQDSSKNRKEICDKFGISDSLLSKIIIEHGGSTRKGKLNGKYEEIQQKIMQGVPIRELAREYKVAKNSISNINRGITAYNPSLSYPLNEEVRDKNLQDSWFKSKV